MPGESYLGGFYYGGELLEGTEAPGPIPAILPLQPGSSTSEATFSFFIPGPPQPVRWPSSVGTQADSLKVTVVPDVLVVQTQPDSLVAVVSPPELKVTVIDYG